MSLQQLIVDAAHQLAEDKGLVNAAYLDWLQVIDTHAKHSPAADASVLKRMAAALDTRPLHGQQPIELSASISDMLFTGITTSRHLLLAFRFSVFCLHCRQYQPLEATFNRHCRATCQVCRCARCQLKLVTHQ